MTSLACALFLSCDRMSRRTPNAEAPENGAQVDGGTDDA
jgi:hypothetical protein